MTTLEPFIAALQALLEELPGANHSAEVQSAREQLGWAIDNLQRAPTDRTVAIARLIARYDERQQERFEIREGLSVSLRESTATKLSALVPVAQVQVAAENPGATFWIDDGGMQLDITAGELLENAADYILRYSELLTWVSFKRQAIDSAEDPLAVTFD